jgi:hypothetical protein
VLGAAATAVDALVVSKLAAAAAAGVTDAAVIYATHFSGDCNALCAPHKNATTLVAGRRLLEARAAAALARACGSLASLRTRACKPSDARCDAGTAPPTQTCDNCFCRQKRSCDVLVPYGVCMACMTSWTACAPTTSHYTTTPGRSQLGIRAKCVEPPPPAAPVPEAVIEAVASPPPAPVASPPPPVVVVAPVVATPTPSPSPPAPVVAPATPGKALGREQAVPAPAPKDKRGKGTA